MSLIDDLLANGFETTRLNRRGGVWYDAVDVDIGGGYRGHVAWHGRGHSLFFTQATPEPYGELCPEDGTVLGGRNDNISFAKVVAYLRAAQRQVAAKSQDLADEISSLGEAIDPRVPSLNNNIKRLQRKLSAHGFNSKFDGGDRITVDVAPGNEERVWVANADVKNPYYVCAGRDGDGGGWVDFENLLLLLRNKREEFVGAQQDFADELKEDAKETDFADGYTGAIQRFLAINGFTSKIDLYGDVAVEIAPGKTVAVWVTPTHSPYSFVILDGCGRVGGETNFDDRHALLAELKRRRELALSDLEDFAGELKEAVVRPSEEDVAAIIDLVRTRPPDLNRQLARYQVRFDPDDAELQAARVPARCGLDGIVIHRLPKTPSDYRWLERLLRHELIHIGQLDRARKRGDVDRMYQGAQKEIVLPSGRVNQQGYDENPQEIMAAAHDAVRRFREAGLSNEQIRQALEASELKRSEAGRRRFLRYAMDYLEA
jgi:hypothetical protein